MNKIAVWLPLDDWLNLCTCLSRLEFQVPPGNEDENEQAIKGLEIILKDLFTQVGKHHLFISGTTTKTERPVVFLDA